MTSLPKWPQCLIYGSPVTEQQAMDIIVKCDGFFHSAGNNHRFIRQVWKDCGFDVQVNDKYLGYPEQPYDMAITAREALGAIELEYLSTSWVSSTYIGGPRGFVHPDGTIAHTKNIGKWPTIEEVHSELNAIASAFPYLDMKVILMSAEEYEDEDKYPIVTFDVKDGAVGLSEIVSAADIIYCYNAYNHVKRSFIPSFKECGLNQRQLKMFTDAYRSYVLSSK